MEKLDEAALRRLLKAEDLTPVGTALRLAWQGGLSPGEIAALRWEQADPDAGTLNSAPMEPSLQRYLLRLRTLQAPAPTDPVLRSPRARKAMRADYLSKLVRPALDRAGLPRITLAGLRSRRAGRDTLEQVLLPVLLTKGYLNRADVEQSLSIPPLRAGRLLRRLTDEGRLTRVGARYYWPGSAVAPDQQEEAVLSFLALQGSAVRQDLTRLLGVGERQLYPLLRRLREEGKISFQNGRYERKRKQP